MLPLLLEAMRPKQWAKNGVVFAALIFDVQLFQPTPLLRTLAGFGLMCLLSSAVYLVNDLADLEKDRQHPQKRNRPLASGRLSKNVAAAAAVVLPLVALPLGFLLDWRFGLLALTYLVKDLLYSLWLKHVAIIDVMLVALGFLLRVGAGVVIITVARFSPWLYICMGLLALFMGFGKRRAELALMDSQAGDTRTVLKEYSLPFLDEMINLVSTSTIIAYSLYTFSAPNLPENHTMMLTIPFVLYSLLRYLYLIHMKGEGGAPDELVLTDRPLQITFLLWGLSAILIMYLNPQPR
ncbi:MAG TPA: decaprenyl-phosphate phosphoribosyltransferase [Anaerolineales bacterium]|nr:decaprenyl-phosphate phosphoribosyltransferase [Anaerolineales bacterium]